MHKQYFLSIRCLVIAILFLSGGDCVGQNITNNSAIDSTDSKPFMPFLDSICKGMNLFVDRKPFNAAEGLSLKDTNMYSLHYNTSTQQQLNINLIRDFITRKSYADQTPWKDDELPRVVLVDRFKKVSLSAVLKKFHVTDKVAKQKYKIKVDRQNRYAKKNIRLDWISRPLIDSSGNFAIIGFYANDTEGRVLLYQKVDGKWKELGVIDMWGF